MRVAVMGAGGLGGYYGAMLARAGADVHLIARGAQLEAICARGLTLKSPQASFNVRVPATSDAAGCAPVDLVLFCVKAYDTAAAAQQVRPVVGPQTTVLTLQNGVENVAPIGAALGRERVLAAASYVSARAVSPGVIETAFVHRTILGEAAGRDPERARGLAATFQAAGIAAEVVPDIDVALWTKLLVMSSLGAVGCVTRLTFGEIHACAETAALRWGIFDEGHAVARAAGVALPDGLRATLQQMSRAVDPGMRPSMYYDLAAGRRLELDDMVGVVVRTGARLGVPTPLTRTIYAALKPYAAGSAPAAG